MNPSEILGAAIIAHWTVDDLSAGLVASWVDRAVGLDWVQATVGKQPTLVADFGGYGAPGLQFSGGQTLSLSDSRLDPVTCPSTLGCVALSDYGTVSGTIVCRGGSTGFRRLYNSSGRWLWQSTTTANNPSVNGSSQSRTIVAFEARNPQYRFADRGGDGGKYNAADDAIDDSSLHLGSLGGTSQYMAAGAVHEVVLADGNANWYDILKIAAAMADHWSIPWLDAAPVAGGGSGPTGYPVSRLIG